MSDKPTENTYTVEFISQIKQLGLGFDAAFEIRRQDKEGIKKPDILLSYKGNLVAVIEVKDPSVPLSDPELNKQARKYAESWRKDKGVVYFGTHNIKYLKLFKHVGKKDAKLDEYLDLGGTDWVPLTDFPFPIVTWARSIEDYKEISSNRIARDNLAKFLLKFKDMLEGKSIDLTEEAISKIGEIIETGASSGMNQMLYLYRNEVAVKQDVERWMKERGLEKPKNDDKLLGYLNVLLKEQLYTFVMKSLFYYVLQSGFPDMASRLEQKLSDIRVSDPILFKKIFDELFQYAIERTGDFEEVFGSNTVDKITFVGASIPKLQELLDYINQIRWSEIGQDVLGSIFEGLIHEERRHLLGQHYTRTDVVDLILTGTIREPKKFLDPCCGSGTFLVRALNYWRIKDPSVYRNAIEMVEGVDIDKLASMLSKINLYIQGWGINRNYEPNILNNDFISIKLKDDYGYVVTNPPYTRQEEMVLAYYNKDYKKNLSEVVNDVPGWSEKASIYAYFLKKAALLSQKKADLVLLSKIHGLTLNMVYR